MDFYDRKIRAAKMIKQLLEKKTPMTEIYGAALFEFGYSKKAVDRIIEELSG